MFVCVFKKPFPSGLESFFQICYIWSSTLTQGWDLKDTSPSGILSSRAPEMRFQRHSVKEQHESLRLPVWGSAQDLKCFLELICTCLYINHVDECSRLNDSKDLKESVLFYLPISLSQYPIKQHGVLERLIE